MANIYSLQLLRNGTAYANKDDAYRALQSASGLTSVTNKDGVAVLARYVAEGDVKTLVGFYADASAMTDDGDGASYMTIIDVEGAAESVDELREEIENILGDGVSSGAGKTVSAQLAALSGDPSTATSADTSVEGAKKYTDGKIAETLDGLDYNLAKDDNKVVVSLNQTDGKISGESVNLTSVKLDGLTAGTDAKIASTDTLGEALAKIQAQVDSMNLAVVSGDGEVITAVSEADGKVAASKTAIKDVVLTGFEANSGVTGEIAATDDIENALNKLNNKIDAAQSATTVSSSDKSIAVTTGAEGTDIVVSIKTGEHVLAKDGNAGIYTNIALSSITPSSEIVKEEYQLTATDGSKLGDSIKIYKDSHIVSITYITDPADAHYQNLEYKYIDASGATKTEYVDISSLVLEAEFASGVTITDHVAHGVVDPTSETFLTVGEDGFKLSGVQDAISGAIQTLDASVTGGTTSGTATAGHVQVVVDEVDGKLTAVTVTETNIANADDLEELSAKTITAITSSNSSMTATIDNAVGCKTVDLITDASKIQMSGFSSTDVLSGISESDSIVNAFGKVDEVITSNEEVIAAALNDLNSKIAELSGDSASGLTEEIEIRHAIEGQSGSTYAANANSRYISGATNMNAADVALNDALVTVADNYVSGITVNGNGLTVANNIAAITVNSANSATTASNGEAITVSTDGQGNITLGLSVLDCGVY